MRNGIIIGIIIIILIIIGFGYVIVNDIDINLTNDDSNQTITMLTVSKEGVTLNYPSNWVYSQATSNDSIMAISKQSYVDSQEIGQVNINIEKQEFEGSFDTFVNKTYTNVQADSQFELISSGEVVINNQNAIEYIYTSTDSNGVVKQHKALWFEKGNEAYVVMYSAPIDKFEVNLPAADYIIDQIQIN